MDSDNIYDTEHDALAAEDIETSGCRKKRVDIFAEVSLPQWYDVHNNTNITRPIIPTKLAEAFSFLPAFGKPSTKEELPEFISFRLQDFMGSGLTHNEFQIEYGRINREKWLTGKELLLPTQYPSPGILDEVIMHTDAPDEQIDDNDYKLCVTKKFVLRMSKDTRNTYAKRLKYRGIRIVPPPQDVDEDVNRLQPEELLEPGTDLLFRVRVYRPYPCNLKEKTQKNVRHSIFCQDMVLSGRCKLTELRDRIVCNNDYDMRIDVSDHIDEPAPNTAKDLFPSGFLFINNVFYVDNRPGCHDTSAVIRHWATNKRGLGTFPALDLDSKRMQDIAVRLGHPEVYVHQGSCEHVFTISEIRLVTPYDTLRQSAYPHHTMTSQMHHVYCTTCAEFTAKWIVKDCDRVPFNPSFFCDTCLRLYLYKDGRKLFNFKAFMYRGNELNQKVG